MSEGIKALGLFSTAGCLSLALLAGCLAAGPAAAQEGGSIGGSLAAPASPHSAGHRTKHAPHVTPPHRAVRAAPAARAAHRSTGGGASFDGNWSVSAGGPCAAAGTSQVVIFGGRISGQGVSGSVSPSGGVRTVGNVNGITVLGHGRISGNTASGSYRQSDGCSGPWSGYRL